MIAEDGVVVDLVDGQASVAGAVPCGCVYVDGLTVGEVTESQLKDRRILCDEGFVSVVIVVDASSGVFAVSAGGGQHGRDLVADLYPGDGGTEGVDRASGG